MCDYRSHHFQYAFPPIFQCCVKGRKRTEVTVCDCLVHRFCTDCKNKVLRAYNILVGELDCTKEKGYCAALYEGLCCCPHERHIHVCCETDFIAHLLGRAEPEFAGGYE